MTLSPEIHRLATAHKSPGQWLEHCARLARLITNDQFSALVDGQVRTGKPVAVQVHEAVKRWLSG